MWFPLTPVDVSFTETSPFRLQHEIVLDAPPARVFEIIATGEDQKSWFPDFIENRWTCREPHGVGSTRDVELKTMTVSERFLVWEPGHRLVLYMERTTLPILSAILEDICMTPEADGKTRLFWTVHYRPRLVMRLVHPIARMVFDRMYDGVCKGLARKTAAS